MRYLSFMMGSWWVLGMLVPGPGYVLAAENPAVLFGHGLNTCADFLAAAAEAPQSGGTKSPGETQRYEDWLAGLVSGLNVATGQDVLRGSRLSEAMTRTKAHCRGHLEQDFFNAAMDLVHTLSELEARKPAPAGASRATKKH